MATLFTDHYLVFTNPKIVFRKTFITGAIIPIIAVMAATHMHYNNSKLTKSMYLGSFLGSLVGAAVWASVILMSEDVPVLGIILLSLYYSLIIAHGICTKIKEKRNGGAEVSIRTHRTWGG